MMLALRLPSEIEKRLADLAHKTGRTKTYYARKAILSFIGDMEDTYLAIERLESPTKTWTQEDLEADLDLEHLLGRSSKKRTEVTRSTNSKKDFGLSS